MSHFERNGQPLSLEDFKGLFGEETARKLLAKGRLESDVNGQTELPTLQPTAERGSMKPTKASGEVYSFGKTTVL